MARFDWSDGAQIAALRLQYVQKPSLPTQSRQNSNLRFGASPDSVRLCISFQRDLCDLPDGHDSLIHACSYCFTNTGMLFKHSEKQCRRKTYASKNGQRGEQ